MWEYAKLVAHRMWALLVSGVLAGIAVLNAIFEHVPVISAIDVSPWFWAAAALVGLVVAQALAAGVLLRRGSGGEGTPVIRNIHHHSYGEGSEVHHHHGPETPEPPQSSAR